MERTVLAEYDLSWVAFTVLWILWIWDTQETGHVAEEAGVTKGTLTGVIKTLQARKLIKRLPHKDDRRRVSIELTAAGEHLIESQMCIRDSPWDTLGKVAPWREVTH